MAKRNYSRFLQAKRLLNKKQYGEYKRQLVETKRAELENAIEQGRQGIKRFRKQQSYSKSRTGRFAQRIQRGVEAIRQPTRVLYRRQQPINSSNVQRVTPMQSQILARARILNQARQQQMQRQQANQNYYDWAVINMANPRHNTAQIVENEINRIGGHASVGDAEAFSMSNLANLSNPIVSVELEANRHSNIQHLNPISRMNQEVNFFANMVF